MSDLPRPDPRYIVLHRKGRVRRIAIAGEQELGDDDEPGYGGDVVVDNARYFLHGLDKPTLFKTLKMASKAVRDGYTWIKRKNGVTYEGKILLFDVNYLPEIAIDKPLFERPGYVDKLSEIEFCERQSQLWIDRAHQIASGK